MQETLTNSRQNGKDLVVMTSLSILNLCFIQLFSSSRACLIQLGMKFAHGGNAFSHSKRPRDLKVSNKTNRAFPLEI